MTLTGQEKGTERIVFRIQKKSKRISERLSQGHWTFLGPGNEEKWHGGYSYKLEGKWDSIGSQMVKQVT